MSMTLADVDAPSDARPRNDPSLVDATPHDGEFTMRQVVALTGVGEHAIRFYERTGVLARVRRQRSSGHRRYTVSDVSTIHTLACLRAMGMSLAEMREYLDLTTQGAEAAPQALEILAAQRVALAEQMRALQERAAYLDYKVAYWTALGAGDAQTAQALGRAFASRVRASATRQSSPSPATIETDETEQE